MLTAVIILWCQRFEMKISGSWWSPRRSDPCGSSRYRKIEVSGEFWRLRFYYRCSEFAKTFCFCARSWRWTVQDWCWTSWENDLIKQVTTCSQQLLHLLRQGFISFFSLKILVKKSKATAFIFYAFKSSPAYNFCFRQRFSLEATGTSMYPIIHL